MKVKYQCEECGNYFATELDAIQCETKHAEARKAAEEDRAALDDMIKLYIETSGTLDKLGQDIAKKSKVPFWWAYLDYVSRNE